MHKTSTVKLVSASAAGALIPSLHAAIQSADFSSSPYVTGVSGNIYVDFDTVSASTTSFGSHEAQLFFESGYGNAKPVVNAASPWVSTSTKFAADATIPTTGSTHVHLDDNGTTAWTTGGQPGYMGFNNTSTGAQAWLYLDYNRASNLLTVLGVGYNDSGALTTGQGASAIPEPASAAAMAALLAGGAAAFQRRRRAA